MLDQNTDRMWFVIGAVLIGAGLIAAANILFPSLFADITKSFTDMLTKATGGLDKIEFNPNVTPPAETINLIKGLF